MAQRVLGTQEVSAIDLSAKYQESKRLLESGRPAEAEAVLREILEEDASETQALVGLGTIASGTGRQDEAIQQMQLALDLDPNCVPALCWMSFLLRKAGRPGSAPAYAERAVAAEPQNPQGFVALARSLRAIGNIDGAIANFGRAADLDPQNAAPQYELAEALLGTRFERNAVEALEKAVALQPRREGLLRLGRLLLELDEPERAERHVRQAIEMGEREPESLALLARILAETGDLETANELWVEADALSGRPGRFSLEKAISLSAIGHFTEAQQDLLKAIDEGTYPGSAFQAYAFAKKIAAEDEALVGRMERALYRVQDGSEKVALLYGLGRAFDSLGDYEKAMQYFDNANALNRKIQNMPRLNREEFSALIDRRIALFSGDRDFQGEPSSAPLFIVGMIRSGTTLTEQALSGHSSIHGAGERYFWADEEDRFTDLQGGSIDEDALLAGASYYARQQISMAPKSKYVIDKNPINFLFLGLIHLGLPNAKILHTIRNPIDTAISIWTTPMKSDAPFLGNKDDIVFAYGEYNRLISHWREVLPSSTMHEIAYESLVREPKRTLGSVLEFIELPWEESVLHPEESSRRVKTPSYWQVRQPFYRSSAERWRNYEPWLGGFRSLL